MKRKRYSITISFSTSEQFNLFRISDFTPKFSISNNMRTDIWYIGPVWSTRTSHGIHGRHYDSHQHYLEEKTHAFTSKKVTYIYNIVSLITDTIKFILYYCTPISYFFSLEVECRQDSECKDGKFSHCVDFSCVGKDNLKKLKA